MENGGENAVWTNGVFYVREQPRINGEIRFVICRVGGFAVCGRNGSTRIFQSAQAAISAARNIKS